MCAKMSESNLDYVAQSVNLQWNASFFYHLATPCSLRFVVATQLCCLQNRRSNFDWNKMTFVSCATYKFINS